MQALPANAQEALTTNGQFTGPARTPYDTGDGVRALAFYFAGAPLAGDGMWCTNTYTPEYLVRLGYERLTPIKAAIEAVKAGKAGIIRFLFTMWPARLISIFDDEEKFLKTNDIEASTAFDRLIHQHRSGMIDLEEFKVRVVCLILKTRSQFMNAWKQQDPLIRIDDAAGARTEQCKDPSEGGTVRHGGFKIISASASKATRDHLRL